MMKIFTLLFVFNLLSPLAWGKELQKIVFSVPKMTCPACASSIERELKKAEEVSGIDINIGSKEVTLTLKDETKVNIRQLIDSIKSAGFDARLIK